MTGPPERREDGQNSPDLGQVPRLCQEILEFLYGRPGGGCAEQEVPEGLRNPDAFQYCVATKLVREQRLRMGSGLTGEIYYDSGLSFWLTDAGKALVSKWRLERLESTANPPVLPTDDALDLAAQSPGDARLDTLKSPAPDERATKPPPRKRRDVAIPDGWIRLSEVCTKSGAPAATLQDIVSDWDATRLRRLKWKIRIVERTAIRAALAQKGWPVADI